MRTPITWIRKSLFLEDAHLFDVLSQMASRIAIVTDANVYELYGKQLEIKLSLLGLNVSLIPFPPGESHKTRHVKERIEDAMLEMGYGRDSALIALGGGITTDLGGFIASTYCRGIPWIAIPTTLLAIVDAALGGKTGVNTPLGKNMIGAFHPPKHVFIDPSLLKTLPDKELKNGLVEMIKHALIHDRKYFDALNMPGKPVFLSKASLKRSIEIKSAIIKKDPFEKDLRLFLNFGHTIGHALEILSDHTLSHGEAVAIGIRFESYLAHLLGHLSDFELQEILSIFKIHGIVTGLPEWISFDNLLKAMQLDKKSQSKIPRFLILKAIGSPLACQPVDPKILKKAFDDLQCH